MPQCFQQRELDPLEREILAQVVAADGVLSQDTAFHAVVSASSLFGVPPGIRADYVSALAALSRSGYLRKPVAAVLRIADGQADAIRRQLLLGGLPDTWPDATWIAAGVAGVCAAPAGGVDLKTFFWCGDLVDHLASRWHKPIGRDRSFLSVLVARGILHGYKPGCGYELVAANWDRLLALVPPPLLPPGCSPPPPPVDVDELVEAVYVALFEADGPTHVAKVLNALNCPSREGFAALDQLVQEGWIGRLSRYPGADWGPEDVVWHLGGGPDEVDALRYKPDKPGRPPAPIDNRSGRGIDLS